MKTIFDTPILKIYLWNTSYACHQVSLAPYRWKENFYIEVAKKKYPLRTGFEPVRAKPIGFRVQLLNHSDTAAIAVSLAFGTFSSVTSTANLKDGYIYADQSKIV